MHKKRKIENQREILRNLFFDHFLFSSSLFLKKKKIFCTKNIFFFKKTRFAIIINTTFQISKMEFLKNCFLEINFFSF